MQTRFDSSRRALLAAAAVAPFAAASLARGATRDAKPLSVGVIGCGGRGTGAAFDALGAASASGCDVRITALADAFADRLASSRQGLLENAPDRATVPEERCFVGLDAYRRLLDTDVDVVLLATPPGFRPIHFAAAVERGKHVFMEKPCAVDGPGIRMVLEAARAADARNLRVVAGTQRRAQPNYIESIGRIRGGAIGRLVGGRCYWNQGGLWHVEARSDRSDVENQMRNWLYHAWLSGDHIVEQHVHQLDVMNWAFANHPVLARGVGGRQARVDPAFGHIYDHFAIEYVYPPAKGAEAYGEAFVLSMCRQQDGTAARVEESLSGTEGTALLRPGFAEFAGPRAWRYSGPNPNPYVEEHVLLQRAIREGTPLNQAVEVAESTLTAIMGRMAAYTGQEVTWAQALASEETLMPPSLEFGSRPVAPVAVPGRTRLA